MPRGQQRRQMQRKPTSKSQSQVRTGWVCPLTGDPGQPFSGYTLIDQRYAPGKCGKHARCQLVRDNGPA